MGCASPTPSPRERQRAAARKASLGTLLDLRVAGVLLPGATDELEARVRVLCSAARERGAEAARASAAWITDGNETDVSRARKLEVLEAEGPAGLDLPLPDLSGEWAGDPTPRSLLRELLGEEELDGLGDEARGELEEAVAEAWEDGRDEAFAGACVAELRRWLPEDASEEPCTDHGFEVCPDCGNGGVKVTAAGYVPCTRFLTCWADADEWAGGAS